MKRALLKLLLFCLLALDLSAAGQPIITAVVTITNQTVFVTNGQTISINGTVRTWTNTVTSAQTQIQQTNNSLGCVTNLFLAYAVVPATGINISYSAAASNVTFQSFAGLPLTVVLSPGWASLGLSTNNIGTNAMVVRGPPILVGNYERTNAANDISLYLTDPAETNQWGTNILLLARWFQLFQSGAGSSGGGSNASTGSINTTNLNILGVGPNAGRIMFPDGDVIQELSPFNFQRAGDSGLNLGIGNGQILGEQYSFVGGASNDIAGQSPSGPYIYGAAIPGGFGNLIGDGGGSGSYGDGSYSFIAGGATNLVTGNGSFAGGRYAHVMSSGSFLWDDGNYTDVSNIAPSQIVFLATNGMAIGTTNTGYMLSVAGSINIIGKIYTNGTLFSGGGTIFGNYIGNLSSYGTNVSLSSTTMLTDASGLLVPNMSSDTSPYGVASASSTSSSAFNAFTNNTWTSGAEGTPWIQYQFPTPVIVNGFVMTTSGGVAANNQLLYSMDGVNWTTNYSNNSNPNGSPVSVPWVLANYVRMNYPGDGPSVSISALNLYGGYLNQVSASSLLSISTPYGVSINSTNSTGSALEVGGNVNSTNGFSIGRAMQLASGTNLVGGNELTISAPVDSIGNSAGLLINGVALKDILVALQNPIYTITGGTNTSVSFNGQYGAWVNPPTYSSTNIYLNSFGEKFGIQSGWTPNFWPSGITSSLYVIFNFSRNQFYTNQFLTGTYVAYGSTIPTNSLTVSGTNSYPAIQAGQTNVVLLGATSMTVYLKKAMAGTNWIPTLTENGGAIPGLSVTGVTTTNFVTSMTALTFTGNLWWTAIQETQ
jgi:hypothetical protein